MPESFVRETHRLITPRAMFLPPTEFPIPSFLVAFHATPTQIVGPIIGAD